MYLVCPSLTAAGGRPGTVVLSSLSPPCQRQTVECYTSLLSNNFASSGVLILFRRNSWQISDLHEGGAVAHELAESQSKYTLSRKNMDLLEKLKTQAGRENILIRLTI